MLVLQLPPTDDDGFPNAVPEDNDDAETMSESDDNLGVATPATLSQRR